MGASESYHDGLVQGWEAVLFGGHPARTLAATLPNRAVSELLHSAYLSYYLIVYGPPLHYYVRRRFPAFGEAMLALTITYAVCFLAFVLFPVQGPRYVWEPSAGIPDGPFRSLALWILERGSSRGTAFPSSHAAVAMAQSVVTLRHSRGLGLVVTTASLLLMVGAVYGGFHYAIDVVTGAALGLTIGVAVIAWRRALDHDVTR
jgi:membrane-associated phospholipid phosphatase